MYTYVYMCIYIYICTCIHIYIGNEFGQRHADSGCVRVRVSVCICVCVCARAGGIACKLNIQIYV